MTSTPPCQLTITRPPPGEMGDPYPITVSLDGERIGLLTPGDSVTREMAPGRHRLRAYNTLMWKSVELDAQPGERLRYVVRNRPGFGTFLFALLGSGPLYVALERAGPGEPEPG